VGREYNAKSDALRGGRFEDGIMMVECRLVTVSVQCGVTQVPTDIVEEVIQFQAVRKSVDSDSVAALERAQKGGSPSRGSRGE
jgi:hypothetical protein